MILQRQSVPGPDRQDLADIPVRFRRRSPRLPTASRLSASQGGSSPSGARVAPTNCSRRYSSTSLAVAMRAPSARSGGPRATRDCAPGSVTTGSAGGLHGELSEAEPDENRHRPGDRAAISRKAKPGSRSGLRLKSRATRVEARPGETAGRGWRPARCRGSTASVYCV